MKKILITGGSQGLGREVYNALSALNLYDVNRIGRSSCNDIFCDLSVVQDITLLLDYIPDIVIHLAASVPDRQSDTLENAKKTEVIDKNIFNACQKWDVQSFYFSGCRLYKQTGEYADEDTAIKSDIKSFYLKAKKEGDVLFQTLDKGVIFRISFPITSCFSNDNIVSLFKKQLSIGKSLIIFNSGIDEQDYVDSRTVIEAIIFLIDNPIGSQGVLNISNATPITIKILAETFIEILNGKTLYKHNDISTKVFARYSNKKLKDRIPLIKFYHLKESLEYHIHKSSLEEELHNV